VQHPRDTPIAQHKRAQSLAPDDEPLRGLRPIAAAFYVSIPGPDMERAPGIFTEVRIVFAQSKGLLKSGGVCPAHCDAPYQPGVHFPV
jgi:hypothetical protein